MQQYPGSPRGPRDASAGLDRAGLVVRVHDRHQNGVGGDGGGDVAGIHLPVTVEAEVGQVPKGADNTWFVNLMSWSARSPGWVPSRGIRPRDAQAKFVRTSSAWDNT